MHQNFEFSKLWDFLQNLRVMYDAQNMQPIIYYEFMMKWAYNLERLMEHVYSQRDVHIVLIELYLNQRNWCPLNAIGNVFVNIYILRDMQRRKDLAGCKKEAFMGTQDKNMDEQGLIFDLVGLLFQIC